MENGPEESNCTLKKKLGFGLHKDPTAYLADCCYLTVNRLNEKQKTEILITPIYKGQKENNFNR